MKGGGWGARGVALTGVLAPTCTEPKDVLTINMQLSTPDSSLILHPPAMVVTPDNWYVPCLPPRSAHCADPMWCVGFASARRTPRVFTCSVLPPVVNTHRAARDRHRADVARNMRSDSEDDDRKDVRHRLRRGLCGCANT